MNKTKKRIRFLACIAMLSAMQVVLSRFLSIQTPVVKIGFGFVPVMFAGALYGAGGGVLFIPAHLVADVVEGAAKTHVKDDFGFEMICQGKFTTAQIDKNTWTEEMLDMLLDWIKADPRGEEYRDLDWSKEYDLARNGDPNDTQTAL